MDFKVGVLREGLSTLVAGVLDYLVVHLVLVSVQRVLGGEDLLAQPAVKLRRFLVDRLNMGFQGLAVAIVLRERFLYYSKTNDQVSNLEALLALVLSPVGSVDPPLVFHQGVVGLEPLAAVSAGEGQLVVVLLAVAHDVLRSDLPDSTIRTEVDSVLMV